MTVSVQTPRNQYVGNGANKTFTYTFRIFDAEDLAVYVDGDLQTYLTDYTVTGVDVSTGGTVVFDTAPANNATITLVRAIVAERTTDYDQSGDFQADTVDRDFDRIWGKVQELLDQYTRTVRLAEFDTGSSLVLPVTEDRANRVLAFDAEGDAVVSTLTLTEIEEQAGLAEDQAIAAAASAAAAAASASSASSSATSASTSATNAATSATSASASATNAAASETAAETAQTAAETAEDNAAASAAAAAISAANAATSETNAAASESAAATSETNAANSASAASTSATNAATSAANAANSATAAQTAQTAAEAAQAAAEQARDDAEAAAYDTVSVGLTATGTNQSGALALTNAINEVTTTASGTGVLLPTPAEGRKVSVFNRGANALAVYPASGHQIDSLSTNAALSLPVGTDITFFAVSNSRWLSHVGMARYS